MGRQIVKSFEFLQSSLGHRFAILVAFILLLSLGISSGLQYRAQSTLFLEGLRSEGKSLGNFMADISAEAIITYDITNLNEYAREITEQEGVVYGMVLTQDNIAITNYIDDENEYVSEIVRKQNISNATDIVAFLRSNKNIMNLSVPIEINDRQLGTVLIGMDQRRVHVLSRIQMYKQLFSFAVTILLTIGGVYIIFRHNVLRPISELVYGSKRVAVGKLEEEVSVRTKDEFGILAKAFNDMMRKLEQEKSEKDIAMRKMEDLNQTLGERVEIRTKELKQLNLELEQMALHDSLTGLPNRALILDRIEHGITLAKRKSKTLAVLMMDLDRFKEINDTIGHHAGDLVLVEVSRRLVGLLREEDTIGRLGGDEFAVILPDTSIHHSKLIAKKILSALDEPILVKGNKLSASASAGIAIYPDHGTDQPTLLRHADVAMYHAKNKKSGFSMYSATQDQHSLDRLSLMTDLRTAIEKNELRLHYQPILDSDQNINCYEVLLRWNHSKLGYIEPEYFVPLAEQTGVMKVLTKWVINNALEQSARWEKEGLSVRLSINLSKRDLEDPDLPEQLAWMMNKWKIGESTIAFEITESTIMSNPGYISNVLENLASMGICLLIDDFGKGYTSLSQLSALPINGIKIDKSFVTDMMNNTNNAVIVRSVIELAHNLGMKVIAEGVETKSVADELRKIGCDRLQGFYTGKPSTPEEIIQAVQIRRLKTIHT